MQRIEKRERRTPVQFKGDGERGEVVAMRKLWVGLLLVSCAPKVWVKPGSDGDEFRVDKYECERDARSVVGNWRGDTRVHFDQDFFRQCMHARGWRLRDKRG